MGRMPETLGPEMKEEVAMKDKGVEEPDRGPEPFRSYQRGSETDRARQINEVERLHTAISQPLAMRKEL